MKKRLLLAVTGSIAAYKSADLVRQLTKAGHSVTCVLSESAQKFVSKFLLENLSENRCYTDDDLWTELNLHIHLARDHDALIIAPASANTLSKCAQGFADNLVTNIILAFEGPVLLAPAMHTEMMTQPVIRQNMALCKQLGHFVIGPSYGELASHDTGFGRFVDPAIITAVVPALFFKRLNLSTCSLIITSGGTKEAIDPVRHISNASSGMLGRQLSYMALLYGAKTSLFSTTDVENIGYHTFARCESASELYTALHAAIDEHDALIMAAAVSDFKVAYSEKKVKRNSGMNSLEISANEDILKSLADKKGSKRFIGFNLSDAADLEKESIRKCNEKGCDYIVGNTPGNFAEATRSYKVFDSKALQFEKEAVPLAEAAYDVLSLI